VSQKTVAVIGASSQRAKFGNKALRAFRHAGYRVVPINPRETTVEGEKAYPTVLDYPGPIDEATMYVPPRIGMQVVDELAQKGVKVVWFNPGADGPDVVRRAEALGLMPLVACSIIGIGDSPGRY
jgi:predicted CoA-binding protein